MDHKYVESAVQIRLQYSRIRRIVRKIAERYIFTVAEKRVDRRFGCKMFRTLRAVTSTYRCQHTRRQTHCRYFFFHFILLLAHFLFNRSGAGRHRKIVQKASLSPKKSTGNANIV